MNEVKNILTKGNIIIEPEKLNKYSSVEKIFLCEKNNTNFKNLIDKNINELEIVDINSLNITEVKILAYKIFCNYHFGKLFYNNKK